MSNIFYNIPLKNKEKLLKRLRAYSVNYRKNSIIIDHLKDNDDIGLVISGNIQIIKNNYNGSLSMIESYYKDDLIIYRNMYLDNNEVDIVCREDSEILILSYSTIISTDACDKYMNQFIKNLFVALNEKIIMRDERIQLLTKRSIRDKLLEYFNMLSRKSASKVIHLPYTFTDLANFLAIDRCAMSREIGYLKDERLITVKGRKITLLYR